MAHVDIYSYDDTFIWHSKNWAASCLGDSKISFRPGPVLGMPATVCFDLPAWRFLAHVAADYNFRTVVWPFSQSLTVLEEYTADT